jgi:hypothetical protein
MVVIPITPALITRKTGQPAYSHQKTMESLPSEAGEHIPQTGDFSLASLHQATTKKVGVLRGADLPADQLPLAPAPITGGDIEDYEGGFYIRLCRSRFRAGTSR